MSRRRLGDSRPGESGGCTPRRAGGRAAQHEVALPQVGMESHLRDRPDNAFGGPGRASIFGMISCSATWARGNGRR